VKPVDSDLLRHFPKYCVNKCPPLNPILGQMSPVHTRPLPSFIFNMYFKITPQHTPNLRSKHLLENDFVYISEAVIEKSFTLPKVDFFLSLHTYFSIRYRNLCRFRDMGEKFQVRHSGEGDIVDG